MQAILPIQFISNGNVKRLGMTLQFDPSQLGYEASSVDVVFGVDGDGYVAFDDSHISPYIQHATIPSQANFAKVTFTIKQGAAGIAHVTVKGNVQPFAATDENGTDYPVTATDGLIDLASGSIIQPIIVTAGTGAAAVIPVNSNQLTQPVLNNNSVTGIADSVSGVISSVTDAIKNIVTPSSIPAAATSSMSISSLTSNPLIKWAGLGLLVYLLTKD